ncbi:MAG TPA: hypothetical protein ENN46_03830 [Candidatus Woesearchaeota archaeon]|nr:hypothetical protein [Candidatus Woesearchaeota archaeon]
MKYDPETAALNAEPGQMEAIKVKNKFIGYDLFMRVALAIVSMQLINLLLYAKTGTLQSVIIANAIQLLLIFASRNLYKSISTGLRLSFTFIINAVLCVLFGYSLSRDYFVASIILAGAIPAIVNISSNSLRCSLNRMLKVEKRGFILKFINQIGIILTSASMVVAGYIADKFPVKVSLVQTNIINVFLSQDGVFVLFLLGGIFFAVYSVFSLFTERRKEEENKKLGFAISKETLARITEGKVILYSVFLSCVSVAYIFIAPFFYDLVKKTPFPFALTMGIIGLGILVPIFSPKIVMKNLTRFGNDFGSAVGLALFMVFLVSLGLALEPKAVIVSFFVGVLGISFADLSFEKSILYRFGKKDILDAKKACSLLSVAFSLLLLGISSILVHVGRSNFVFIVLAGITCLLIVASIIALIIFRREKRAPFKD